MSDPANVQPSDDPQLVEGAVTPVGDMGQIYLASGDDVGMRLWEGIQPGDPLPPVARGYETVGYVLAGRALLHLPDDKTLELEVGGSWLVPEGVEHTYEITEEFTAVEATSPPARVVNRELDDLEEES